MQVLPNLARHQPDTEAQAAMVLCQHLKRCSGHAGTSVASSRQIGSALPSQARSVSKRVHLEQVAKTVFAHAQSK